MREFIVQNPCTMPAAKAPPPPPAARTGRRLGPLAALGGGLAVLAPLLAAYGLGGPAGPAARLAAALCAAAHGDTARVVAEATPGHGPPKRKRAWLDVTAGQRGLLGHLEAALVAAGFEVDIEVGADASAANGGEWDLLWAHRDAFAGAGAAVRERAGPPRGRQAVNQWPGMAKLANKTLLAGASAAFDFLPATFRLPAEAAAFRAAAAARPGARWLLKVLAHRGVRAVQGDPADLRVDRDALVQEFVEPRLHLGHAFDLGLYVAVTSLAPLRVYRFSDLLVRFCREPYRDPFGAEREEDGSPVKPERYAVGDDYRPVKAMGGLSVLHARKYNAMEAMRQALGPGPGEPGEPFDRQVARMEEAALRLLAHHAGRLAQTADREAAGGRSFFQLMRFDFVLGTDGKPMLVEVNQSPNLSSAEHPELAAMFRRLAFDLLSLAGLADGGYRALGPDAPPAGLFRDAPLAGVEEMETRDCYHCFHKTCRLEQCARCWLCRSEDESMELKALMEENFARRGFERIHPSVRHNAAMRAADWHVQGGAGAPNEALYMGWVDEKCKHDLAFCGAGVV